MTDSLDGADSERIRRHPNGGDLYTPVGVQFFDLLDLLHREYGSWRVVAWKTELRLKQLRTLRSGERKAISLRVLDRMITTSGVGDLSDFTFFTAEDLVKLGIWKEPRYVEGNKRIQGSEITVAPEMTRLERERLGRKKRRDKIAKRKKREKLEAKQEAAKWKPRRRGWFA
jgi:hypothetical protein